MNAVRRGSYSINHWHSIPCVIVKEYPDYYIIKFIQNNVVKFLNVNNNLVTDIYEDVGEKEYFAIKNSISGAYHSSSKTNSSAPSVYTSFKKADSRRKQINFDDNWQVIKWHIKEEIV